MRRLGNTLYILSDDLYLTVDGMNVVAKRQGAEMGRIPLHTLASIYSFSYMGASPALMGRCADEGIELAFFTSSGRFLADVAGMPHGNVLLRQRQSLMSQNREQCLVVSKNFILAKVFNSKWVLERCIRDHGMRVDVDSLKRASQMLSSSLRALKSCSSIESLRGIEGDAAAEYFAVFNELVLNTDKAFEFRGRNKQPPLDPVNAMLSLFYTMLSLDCSSALRGAGLDPYIGFMHTDRPGRRSLALDCMEELRPILVDRFVLTVINNRTIKAKHFETRENGEVRLTDDGRKVLFDAWQEKKREVVTHPFLHEKMPYGLVPYVQAQLLAQYVRGDIDGYPPFMWK
ncbi:type I-C CRISPR-associated endonuclease Cas1c [Olsenella sp. Marseille-P4559]|uniref:type I-C CRISPR-associated endonuclease Cas1c n=1 Tax=Olsenella sp. Marseille-P4559 TaxID=2364795 RepID=UPI0010325B67|nr:type I-C CRISPR-associated endonuclease Cas1c [Olsenella sp. Marseille-P4559]